MSNYKALDNYVDPATLIAPAEGIVLPQEQQAETPEFDIGRAHELSRDLDSSVASLARINFEDEYKLDPDYNLDDLDELLKDVPEHYQGRLQEELLDARSAEHALFIKGRYQEEMQMENELSAMGWKGFLTRIGTNIADEGAIALTLATGPMGHVAKFTRLKNAARMAAIGGAENMALEAVLKEGSQSRTMGDVFAAGLFGAVLGGGVGAAFKGAAPGSSADDILGDAARAGEKGIKDFEQAAVEDALNKPIPAPKGKLKEAIEVETNDAFDEVQRSLNTRASRAADDTPDRTPDTQAPAKAESGQADPKLTGRLSEIDEAVAKARAKASEIPAPVKSGLIDQVTAMGKALADFRASIGNLTGSKRTNAEIKVQDAKRKFLQSIRDGEPGEVMDSIKSEFTGVNPKLAEFEEFFKNRVPQLVDNLQKKFEADNKSFTDQLDAIDDEIATLKAEADGLKAQLGSAEDGLRHAGAAETGTRAKTLGNLSEDVLDYIWNYPKSALLKWRFDMHAATQRSTNPIIRVLGDVLSEDSVGKVLHNADGVGASEIAEMALKTAQVKFAKVVHMNYPQWLKNNGLRGQKHNPTVRKAYMREVTEAVEKGDGSPEVMIAARAWSDSIEKIRAFAERGGMEGFDEMVLDPHYVPRMHDFDAISDAARRYSWKGPKGSMNSPIEELVRLGIRKAQPDIDDALARRIAKNYVKTVRNLGAGAAGRIMDMGSSNVDYIRGILDEIDIDADGIEYVTQMMLRANQKGDGAKVGHAKHRTLMDLDVEIRVLDEDTAQPRMLSLKEFFERDAEKLLSHYSHSVGGMASIANRTKGTPMHMRSKADVMRWIEEAKKLEHDEGARVNRIGSKYTIDSESQAIEMFLKRTLGESLYDANTPWNTGLRRLRDWNFITKMGQVAFAQMAEFGPMIGQVGFREMLQQMPGFKTFIRNARNGALDDELADVMENWTGLGSDRIRHAFSSRWDIEDGGLGLRNSKTDLNLDRAKHLTAAPMHALMALQQRWTSMALMQRFANVATGARKADGWMDRLGDLGIDKGKLDRINSQIRKYGVDRDGNALKKGGKISNPRFDDWDDLDARDAILNGINRQARRIIQENDIGGSAKWQNSAAGATIGQFRAFVMQAWSKMFLANMHHRDMSTFMSFTGSMFAASVAYVGQTHLKSLGKDEKSRKAYLKTMLSDEAIAKAAFQRAGWSSLMPGAIDSVLPLIGQEQMFNYRSSGLKTDFAQGIPAYDTIVRGYKAAAGAAQAITDDNYNYSRNDWYNAQAVIPWSNLIGVSNVMNMVGANLPKYSER